MSVKRKSIAVILSLIMLLSTVPIYVFAASDLGDTQESNEMNLSFKTEIYKYNAETEKWVVATNVERGETVKARVFIETSFAAGDGQVICFFNNEVFSAEEARGLSIVTNRSETSTAYKFLANGSYSTASPTHNNVLNLVKYGYITKEFLETHSPIIFTFRFESYKCRVISGDEWFVEFELKVKDDAFGKGDFLIVPETIVNSVDGYYAYINMTTGEEGQSTLECNKNLMDTTVNAYAESKPVSSGYARAIFDANGGTISENSSNISTVISKVGDIVTMPDVNNRNDFTFGGWTCDDNNNYNNRFPMPDYNINFTAQWTAKSESTTVIPTAEPTTTATTVQAPTTESTTQTETTTAVPTTDEPITTATTTQAPTTESTTQTETTTVVPSTTEPTTAATTQAPTTESTTQTETTTVVPTTTEPTTAATTQAPTTESTTQPQTTNPPISKPQKIELNIKTPSITSIDYCDSIYLHATADLPDDAKIVWGADNSNFSYKISDNGKTCLISPSSNGQTTFTAKVIDKENNVISDIKTQKMTSNAGLFKKIIGFFKKLFGLIKVYDK